VKSSATGGRDGGCGQGPDLTAGHLSGHRQELDFLGYRAFAICLVARQEQATATTPRAGDIGFEPPCPSRNDFFGDTLNLDPASTLLTPSTEKLASALTSAILIPTRILAADSRCPDDRCSAGRGIIARR